MGEVTRGGGVSTGTGWSGSGRPLAEVSKAKEAARAEGELIEM